MKKFLYILLAFAAVSCTGTNEIVVGNKTTIDINLIHDAGEVLKGEMITAKFKIKNTGDYPLVIAEVKGSCSCTVAEWPEEPLLPGEEGEVMAHVNTDQTGAGILNKSVRIVANTEPSITQVLVKALVKAK